MKAQCEKAKALCQEQQAAKTLAQIEAKEQRKI